MNDFLAKPVEPTANLFYPKTRHSGASRNPEFTI